MGCFNIIPPIKTSTWNHNMTSHLCSLPNKLRNIFSFCPQFAPYQNYQPGKDRSPQHGRVQPSRVALLSPPSIFVATVAFHYFPSFLVQSYFRADCKSYHYLRDLPRQVKTVLFSDFKSQTSNQFNSTGLGLLPNSNQNMPTVRNTQPEIHTLSVFKPA